jgi:LCP family protein required for cell wall assembly
MFRNKKTDQPKRFDVNRTMVNPNRKYRAPTHNELEQDEEHGKWRKWKKRLLRFSWKRALLLVFIIILIPLFYIGYIAMWDYHNYSHAAKKMFGDGNLIGALGANELKSENGRTNILIAGFSNDDPGHSGAKLTDSIMIMSLDKDSKTGYMLSVPRDLYADIPGYGYAKINEAYQYGQSSHFHEKGYAKGGMGILEKIISKDFNIKLDYYVLINYGAVRGTVNALHGITVTIKSTDPRGIYDPNFRPREGGPLKLKNGKQKIDGKTALRLTRARGETYGSYGLALSDFDRTKNQRAVIKGIKDKINTKLLIDPHRNKPLLDAIANNIKTDLKLNNVLPLYRVWNSIPDKELKSVGLRNSKKSLVTGYTTPTGQSALIPNGGVSDYSEIRALIKKLNQ